MLWFGQVLNALIVFSVYLLAKTLTRNCWVGVLASMFTGLYTPMPAYYTSWGRYTHLAGLIILPITLALIPKYGVYQGSDQEGNVPAESSSILNRFRYGRWLLLATISTAGLWIVHYRAAAFQICLVSAYLAFQVRFKPKRELFASVKNAILILVVLFIGAFLFTIPWMLPNLTDNLPAMLNPTRTVLSQPLVDFAGRFLTAGLGTYVLVLSLMGFIIGLIQKKGFVLVLVIWGAAMVALANLGVLGLPGSWLVNQTSVEITLFMPLSVLAGYAISHLVTYLAQVLPDRLRGLSRWTLGCAWIAVTCLGAYKLLPILNPTTDLFRMNDLPAMQWIEENIPLGDTILINPFSWGYGLYAGNDGGYWISPLTGRETLPPPVIYGFGDPIERETINSKVHAVLDRSEEAGALADYLRSLGIKYIYLGGRGGPISPDILRKDTNYRTIYTNAGVWVFEVIQGTK
jgi:hypothetical protein